MGGLPFDNLNFRWIVEYSFLPDGCEGHIFKKFLFSWHRWHPHKWQFSCGQYGDQRHRLSRRPVRPGGGRRCCRHRRTDTGARSISLRLCLITHIALQPSLSLYLSFSISPNMCVCVRVCVTVCVFKPSIVSVQFTQSQIDRNKIHCRRQHEQIFCRPLLIAVRSLFSLSPPHTITSIVLLWFVVRRPNFHTWAKSQQFHYDECRSVGYSLIFFFFLFYFSFLLSPSRWV